MFPFLDMLLLHRNAPDNSFDNENVTRFLSSFFFLSTRYTWNSGDVNVGEPELFELLHGHRRRLIAWLDQAAKDARGEWVQALSNVYTSAMGDDPPDRNTSCWCLVSGEDSKGRYAVTRNKKHVAAQRLSFDEPAPVRRKETEVKSHRFLISLFRITGDLSLKLIVKRLNCVVQEQEFKRWKGILVF